MYFDDTYGIEDWIGLLELREGRAKKHPSDLYAQQRFAEVLNLNKRYKETLDLVTPLYRKNYESGFGVYEIIDALYGLGKTENDFNWIIKPIVLKLDSYTLQLCIDFLRPKRKVTSITDKYCELIMKADYWTFNEKDLAEYLIKYPDKFDIKKGSDYFGDIELKIKRK